MTEIKKYYRSIDQLEQSPEFRELLQREFPDVDPVQLDPVSRRRFLQLLGASATLASVAGCRWEKQKVMTFNERASNRTPGVPQKFATAMELAGVAQPLVVTTFDGRPIKAEGNLGHPASRGATSAAAQASLLTMYDPERGGGVNPGGAGGAGEDLSYEQFMPQIEALLAELAAAKGSGFAILSGASSSLTMADLRDRLQRKWPSAAWHEYEPISDDERREGSRLAFGSVFRPLLRLDRADVILSLDCDLFGGHPDATRLTREFAARRDPDSGAMNRLYTVESNHTLTGSAADHRLPLRSSLVGSFLSELAAALGVDGLEKTDRVIGQPRIQGYAQALAADLKQARGTGLVVVGDGQPAAVHALAHRLNAWLGNAGKTIEFVREADEDRDSHGDSLRSLVTAIEAGSVKTLLILGGNPVYDAPADIPFGEALSKVATSFHLGLYADETSALCTWHLPMAHFLECWADSRTYDGTLTVAQPTLLPLHGGKSTLEVLALFMGDDLTAGLDLVQRTYRKQVSPEESSWNRALHDGLVAGTAWRTETAAVRSGLPEIPAPDDSLDEVENGRFELTFAADAKLFDGRFSNNGWLQELPGPMTRMCWDNAALIGPSTAARVGVRTGDMVRLEVNGRSLEMAAYVMPGMAQGSVSVALGYGRTAAGAIGGSTELKVDPVGFNTYLLRGSDAAQIATGLRLTATGGRHELAMAQDHHMMDTVGMKGREERIDFLIREGDVGQYEADPEFARKPDAHGPPLVSLWDEHPYEGKRWGMAIDLTKCTGCSACVVACQAENNIPIVGKQRVIEGREMHWLRIDRYFSGDVDAPESASQPIACQQCENAPCEEVCPASATMHTREGLNDMVYNRCIGTRYCSNNCPFKVRRFNFFNYHLDLNKEENEVKKMLFNPDVTVRARGVMEKCSFCTQNIVNARIRSKLEGREVPEDELQPACARTCPADAISFGDLNDPSARVTKDHANKRSYPLLAMLNVKPRNAFLARIRNPNPALARDTAEPEQH